MATIEFKNQETQQFFEQLERKEIIFAKKCIRILELQKSGLCSQPIEAEES